MKVRYYCHAGQRTGYGVAAVHAAMALVGVDNADCRLEIRPLAPRDSLDVESMPPILRDLLRTDAELDPTPDVVLVHTLPLDCRRVLEIAGGSWSNTPKTVAYTTWEAIEIPDVVQAALDPFDQFWHPSRLADLARHKSGHVIPHAFESNELGVRRRRERPPGPYRFYYVGAWNSRKNPAGIVRAFASAFDKGDDVELLLSCHGNGMEERLLHTIFSTGFSREDLPRIRLEPRYMPDDDILALHQMADCYVSASRGEAWNLPAFDAAVSGRHVIAQRNLGHDEFLSLTSAVRYPGFRQPCSLDIRVVPIVDDNGVPRGGPAIQSVGAQGLTGKCHWLDPDLRELASMMRYSYEHRIDTLQWYGTGGGVNPNAPVQFGYERVGRMMRKTLQSMFKPGETT